MGRELGFLREPLQVAAEPGLDSTDPRLAAVTDLGAADRYAEAADRAQELFQEHVYDVRPLSLYLYEAFVEGGFGALADVLDALRSVLGDNLAAFGPAKRRQEHVDRRLGWLFHKVQDALEYHEKRSTPEWARWLTQGPVAPAVRAGQELKTSLGDAYPNAMQALGSLTSRLAAMAEAYDAKPATAPAAPTASPSNGAEAPPARPHSAGESGATPSAGAQVRVELAVSYRFTELCDKLRAFEALVQKEKYEKAALVADDVMSALESFDPRSYFPELFARFSALMSKHVTTLSPHWENRESVSWRALTQFYRVDLKSFIDD